LGTEREADGEGAARLLLRVDVLSGCMTAALGEEDGPRLADLALWTSIVRLNDCDGEIRLEGFMKGMGVVDWS
jgi:hypothetical protein